MVKYQLFPVKKIWFILGIVSLLCVENINSSNKGCPPIYEVLEYELNVEKSIINNICRTEYYVDESSADESGDDTKPHFKSICSFDCDEYVEFCPLLSKKLHYALIYDYSDLRWKYNEILNVCKKWDEYYYTTDTPDTTTTDTTTTSTTTTSKPITTTIYTEPIINKKESYSKGGTIGIVSVIGIMLGSIAGVVVYLCRK